jgi:hypothetical protein
MKSMNAEQKLIMSFCLITLLIIYTIAFTTIKRAYISIEVGFFLLLGLVGVNFMVHELITRKIIKQNKKTQEILSQSLRIHRKQTK